MPRVSLRDRHYQPPNPYRDRQRSGPRRLASASIDLRYPNRHSRATAIRFERPPSPADTHYVGASTFVLVGCLVAAGGLAYVGTRHSSAANTLAGTPAVEAATISPAPPTAPAELPIRLTPTPSATPIRLTLAQVRALPRTASTVPRHAPLPVSPGAPAPTRSAAPAPPPAETPASSPPTTAQPSPPPATSTPSPATSPTPDWRATPPLPPPPYYPPPEPPRGSRPASE